jgi:hypothetical protein
MSEVAASCGFLWAGSSSLLVAGTLTVERVEQDQRTLESLVFDPTGVVPGLELSSDVVSFSRRGIRRVASAAHPRIARERGSAQYRAITRARALAADPRRIGHTDLDGTRPLASLHVGEADALVHDSGSIT